MGDAAVTGWANQLIELTKILLAVAVGFFSSVLLKKYDSRKSILNVKAILFKELSVNYDNLNKVLPKDDKFHPALYDLPVQICRSLQHAAYDNYLGRLAELHKSELEKIFDTYHRVRELRAEATTLNEANATPHKEAKDVFQLRVNVFLQNAAAARQKMEDALRVFKDGKDYIMGSLEHRGVEYEKLLATINQITKSK